MHGLFRTKALKMANNEIKLIIEFGKGGKAFAKYAIALDTVRYLYCHNIDEFLNFSKTQDFIRVQSEKPKIGWNRRDSLRVCAQCESNLSLLNLSIKQIIKQVKCKSRPNHNQM